MHWLSWPALAFRGFIAGALATVIFHQGMWALLHYADLPGLGMPIPFPTERMPPFDMPRIVSLAFWAGVYGAVFAIVLPRVRAPVWLAGIGLGIFASLVGGLIVAPLRGQATAFGGDPMTLARSLLINGFWGFGTGLILPLLGPVPRPAAIGTPDYVVQGEHNVAEALGLVRGWATTVIQIETAIVGGAGAAVLLRAGSDGVDLSTWQSIAFLIAMLACCQSIFAAVTLLNVLPGAAQRIATSESARGSDIYAIYTFGRMTIGDWAHNVRWGFIVAIAGLGAFVVLRVLGA
jgi:hypothetical protein